MNNSLAEGESSMVAVMVAILIPFALVIYSVVFSSTSLVSVVNFKEVSIGLASSFLFSEYNSTDFLL